MEHLKEFVKKLFKKKTKKLASPKQPVPQWKKIQNPQDQKRARRAMVSGYQKRSKNSRRKKK